MALHSILSIFTSPNINFSMIYCGYINLSDSLTIQGQNGGTTPPHYMELSWDL